MEIWIKTSYERYCVGKVISINPENMIKYRIVCCLVARGASVSRPSRRRDVPSFLLIDVTSWFINWNIMLHQAVDGALKPLLSTNNCKHDWKVHEKTYADIDRSPNWVNTMNNIVSNISYQNNLNIPYKFWNFSCDRLSIAIVLLEHHLTPGTHHSSHLSGLPANFTSAGQCWLTETFTVVEQCSPCSGKVFHVVFVHMLPLFLYIYFLL